MRGPNKIEGCFVPSSKQAISLQIPWLPGGQNFNSRLCDPRRANLNQHGRSKDVARHLQQRFFELGTSLPVYRRRRPVIGPMNLVPITSKIYHL